MSAMPKLLRNLSYHPWVIRAVRGVGLREPARKLYHRLASPHDGFLRMGCGGTSALFITDTPAQLRAVEAGTREPSLAALLHFIRAGDVVYDVGSHVGLYAIFLAQKVGVSGMVLAFEPHQETYGQLCENVQLNRLNNVRTFDIALGDQSCKQQLYTGGIVGNYSLLPGAVIGTVGKDKRNQLVQVEQGDRFVAAKELPVPRVVKIDVEGYEHEVIHGLRQTLMDPKCEVVCCEVHPKLLPSPVTATAICRLLKSLGYGRIEASSSEEPYSVLAYKS